MMRGHKGIRLYSARDLTRFLECHHCTWLDIENLQHPLEKAEDDEEARLLQEKGIAHEQAYLAQLRDAGLTTVEIPQDGALEARVSQTRDAIGSGPDIIYQAALLEGSWHGYADFLRRVDRGVDKRSQYEVIDTKLARTPAARHLVQLCVYSELLGVEQGVTPHAMHLVLGDGREVSYRTEDFSHYFRVARRRFEEFVQNAPPASYPEPCRYCERCDWRSLCNAQWEKDDHLILVAGIQRLQIRKLNDAGVTTVRSLAELPVGAKVPGMSSDARDRLRSQAELQVYKRDTGEDRVEILPGIEQKGFARLPCPDPADIFLDFEGDPLYPDGLEYLAGVYLMKKGQPVYRTFWAHSHEEERRSFQQLMDFISRQLKRHPGGYVYHYGHYEETALKRLASRYAVREDVLDDLLRNQKLVDLYKVVREGIRVSEPGYSLKNLEVFYMEERAGEVKTAGESVVVYERWLQSRDGTLLEEIARYNEADCRSTFLLREWLLQLRPAGTSWFDHDLRETDEAKAVARREIEEKRAAYEQKLLEGAAPGEIRVGELTGYLLEFHRREEKPGWWAMFARRDYTEDELIDDPECLGGLRLDRSISRFDEARSRIYTYSFPPQDSKISPGDRCLCSTTLEPAGTIYSIDESGCRVQIKRSKARGELPAALSIIPEGPVGSAVLRDAIYRFAGAVIGGVDRYKAVRSLLARGLPALKGHKPGASLIDVRKDTVAEATRVASNLREGFLFIQGPPGSGKTYTASRIILDRIRARKKVGVASNSHKAINNLLSAVEQGATEEGISFSGLKKSNDDRPETFFNGRFIRNFTKYDEMDFSVDLIAGTAWLFAREEMDQRLDYLFVDEAGQVSLANLVAMGLSARNVVLVGDQMQLAQPIQGVHPGESGLSVLEYLLQGEATIPQDRGIFLPTTRRMHDDVCRFISEAVYDGRLKPEPQNRNQQLILGKGAHPALIQSGIRFVPVEHAGCSQKSEEEGRVIREIYESLLNQRFRDRSGKIHSMAIENILVVAPYNLQVNHLATVLPAGARVGTVDKFQGQEAEVVLVSMATSSGEDLPRHIEFLYSRNRLNVAISRARSLAVVVASPRLLEVPCQTVEQMQLVNTLCWVSLYAD